MRYGINRDIEEDTVYCTDHMEEVIEEFEDLKDFRVIVTINADLNQIYQK